MRMLKIRLESLTEGILLFFRSCKGQLAGLFLLLLFFFGADQLIYSRDFLQYSAAGWFRIVLTALFWSLLFLLPALCFGKKSRWFYGLLFCVMLLIDLAECFTWCHFGMLLTGEFIFVMLVSSWEECRIFLESYWGWRAFMVLLLAGGLLAAAFRGLRRTLNFSSDRRTRRMALAAGLLFAGYYLCLGMPPAEVLNQSLLTFLPVDIVRNVYLCHTILDGSAHPELPEKIEMLPPVSEDASAKPLVGMIVIGESASRNYMHLYGYSRDTTPEMDRMKKDLLVFTDVCGSANVTGLALHKLLSQATVKNPYDFKCSLWNIYQKAGYKVIFISNQGRWKYYNGLMQAMFQAADEKLYGEDIRRRYQLDPVYDGEMIPVIREEIQRNSHRNLILCIQLVGSHQPPEKFYPPEFQPFSPDFVDSETDGLPPQKRRHRNHYDNSIAYTDQFLARLIQLADSLDRRSFVFYISDHGETPKASSWRKFNDLDLWEIPMILWTSPEYRRAYPSFMESAAANVDKPMQSEFLFWGLVSMARITTADFPAEKDVFGPRYCPPAQRWIMNRRVIYPSDPGLSDAKPESP